MLKANRPCPKCRAEGRDSTGNHLYLSKSGEVYICRKRDECGAVYDYDDPVLEQDQDFDYMSRKRTESRSSKEVSTDIHAIHGLPYGAIPDRCLSKETVEYFKVKLGYSEVSGEVSEVHFPIVKDRRIIGYKTKKLNAQKGKNYFITGETEGQELFGQSVIPENKGKKLIVTEGELDAMSAWQMLMESSRNRGKDFIPSVVSLPNGASLSGILTNLKFLDSFDEIILCTDMDEPGRKAADKIAMELSRSGVYLMEMSEKDASDMLTKGKEREFVNAFFRAKEWQLDGIVRVTKEDLMTPNVEGVPLPFPKLQEMLHGLRKHEITLFTAGYSVGKSSFVREIALFLMKKDYKIGNIFLEESVASTAKTYVAMDNNIRAGLFKVNPGLIPEEKIDASLDLLNRQSVFHNHFGSLSDEQLITKLRYMVKVEKCDFIILDHISMVVSGRQSSREGERKDIDMLMTALGQFVVDNPVGLLVISHLTRSRDKNWNGGDMPDLKDLRGSGSLEQVSWNVISLSRDMQGELPNKLSVSVLKNREFGYTGKADVLMYDTMTGRMNPVNEDDEEF